MLVLFSPPKIDSDIFVNKNLVLATVNSRKGALGYLRLSGLPGNVGLWDQLQAIHWLRENLSRFGGDPSRLTIGGVGQAAEETHAHLLSQHATGLVSKAILDSGQNSSLIFQNIFDFFIYGTPSSTLPHQNVDTWVNHFIVTFQYLLHTQLPSSVFTAFLKSCLFLSLPLCTGSLLGSSNMTRTSELIANSRLVHKRKGDD